MELRLRAAVGRPRALSVVPSGFASALGSATGRLSEGVCSSAASEIVCLLSGGSLVVVYEGYQKHVEVGRPLAASAVSDLGHKGYGL